MKKILSNQIRKTKEKNGKNKESIKKTKIVKNVFRKRKRNKFRNVNINRINAPTTYGTTTNFKNKPIRIRKREFVCDVNNSVTSTKNKRVRVTPDGLITSIVSLFQNAGLTSSFPWLSSIADGFEKFLFHTLKFNYIPTCPTSTDGSIIMSYNSNPAKPENSWDESAYSTKSNSVQSSLWKNCELNVPVKKLQETTKSKLIRKSAPSDNEDINLTDMGIVDIVTNSPTTDTLSQLGKLYVDYDVSLINPKLNVKVENFLMYSSDFESTIDSYATEYSSTSQPGVITSDGSMKVKIGNIVANDGDACVYLISFRDPNSYYHIILNMEVLSGASNPLNILVPYNDDIVIDETLHPWNLKNVTLFSEDFLTLTSNEVSEQRTTGMYLILSPITGLSTAVHLKFTLSISKIDPADIINYQHQLNKTKFINTKWKNKFKSEIQTIERKEEYKDNDKEKNKRTPSIDYKGSKIY